MSMFRCTKVSWQCRSLIAVGTLATASTEGKQLAKDLNFSDILQQIQDRSALEAKLKSVCQELDTLLQ